MFQKLTSKWKGTVPHLVSMIKQLFFPAIFAAGYGLWDWSSSEGDFKFSEYLKIVMPALFFMMWFVGLYERQKKRSLDLQSFDSLDQQIKTLSSAVNKLNPNRSVTSPYKSPQQSLMFSQNMMTEAENVFNSGHHIAGLLQAGVAFEQAIRSFAKRNKFNEADNMPLLHILKKVDFLLPPGVEGELHALRQVRNRLAHASENELKDIQQTENILASYRWAIEMLENNA